MEKEDERYRQEASRREAARREVARQEAAREREITLQMANRGSGSSGGNFEKQRGGAHRAFKKKREKRETMELKENKKSSPKRISPKEENRRKGSPTSKIRVKSQSPKKKKRPAFRESGYVNPDISILPKQLVL